MWIVPKNVDVSASVRATLESSWDLDELSKICEQSLMWRSKLSLARTWLQRLKRVNWMRLLSGRILKPSIVSCFETEYISLLAVIPASHSPQQEKDKERTTLDTFGRILKNTSVQLDLFGASSKMSQDTSLLDSMRFSRAFEIWITQLRQEYLVRMNAAKGTLGDGFTFLPTPTQSDWKHTGTIEAALRYLKSEHQAHTTVLMQSKGFGTPHLPPLEEMMGLDINWTDLGSWATELSHKQQN